MNEAYDYRLDDQHECCNDEQLELLSKILERLTEVDAMPIGKSFWVNDLAKKDGKVVYWTGVRWKEV